MKRRNEATPVSSHQELLARSKQASEKIHYEKQGVSQSVSSVRKHDRNLLGSRKHKDMGMFP